MTRRRWGRDGRRPTSTPCCWCERMSRRGAVAAHQAHRAARRTAPGRPLGAALPRYRYPRLWRQAAGLAPRAGASRGRLILPHPEMHRRAFVLVPLLEVDPHWRHPALAVAGRTLLARLGRRAAAVASANLLISQHRHATSCANEHAPRKQCFRGRWCLYRSIILEGSSHGARDRRGLRRQGSKPLRAGAAGGAPGEVDRQRLADHHRRRERQEPGDRAARDRREDHPARRHARGADPLDPEERRGRRARDGGRADAAGGPSPGARSRRPVERHRGRRDHRGAAAQRHGEPDADRAVRQRRRQRRRRLGEAEAAVRPAARAVVPPPKRWCAFARGSHDVGASRTPRGVA